MVNRLIEAEDKIRLVIMSCRSIKQLEVAERMVGLYNKIEYKPGFFSSSYAGIGHSMDRHFTHKSLARLCESRLNQLLSRNIQTYKHC